MIPVDWYNNKLDSLTKSQKYLAGQEIRNIIIMEITDGGEERSLEIDLRAPLYVGNF